MSDELAALVQYRLEQAFAALNDAKYLLDGCRSPHSIVNRAYYAMFYAALALLQKAGKIPSKHAGGDRPLRHGVRCEGCLPARRTKRRCQ